MYAADCPSEVAPRKSPILRPQRVQGRVGGVFERDGRKTIARDVSQAGGYRLAFPSTFADHLEATQVNTGGGVAGGDHIVTNLLVHTGADAVFTTQGAERVYRSDDTAARLDVSLMLEAGGRLDWLPQQTILYAGARLQRRIDVSIVDTGRLLFAEVMTFGRIASSEGESPIWLDDQWRIRRDGRLILAEAFRMSGSISRCMGGIATGGGARTSAVLIYVAPEAPDRLEAARAILADFECECGISTWNGLLAARMLGLEPASVINATKQLASLLGGRGMPRVWAI